MPLRITKGIPIPTKGSASGAGAPGPNNFAPDGTLPTGANAPEPVTCTPPIEAVVQKQSEWCWAACVEMVLSHYNRHQDQCAVVAAKLTLADNQQHDCCGDNERNFELVACENLLMDDVWRRFDFKTDLKTDGVHPLDVPLDQLEFSKIQEEINNNRPVEVGIKWHVDRGGGHAILIVGWVVKDGEPAVLVNDPLPTSLLGVHGQSGTLTLSELKKAFGHGKWIHSWTGLVPKDNP